MTVDIKPERIPTAQRRAADDAREVDIKRLDQEFASMGAAPSPNKALNRMKAAIARDKRSKK